MTQRGIHRRGVHDLAGVEDVRGVKERLHLAHQLVTMVTDHQRNEFAAQPSVTMFPAQGPSVFFHEICDVGSDITKHFLSLRRLEIEEWSGVKFT